MDLTSVSRDTRVLSDNIELALRQDIDSGEIIKALDELKLASDFIAEAAIDTLKNALPEPCYTPSLPGGHYG